MHQKQKQVQVQKTRQPEKTDDKVANIQNDKLTEDVDDLLDEIDAVLEPNAEAFVKGYQQKGGQ
jgi:ubiquitin-like protein Pup